MRNKIEKGKILMTTRTLKVTNVIYVTKVLVTLVWFVVAGGVFSFEFWQKV